MCRNIKQLFNFETIATNKEIHDAAVQFVWKVSGMQKPGSENQLEIDKSVEEITVSIEKLFDKLKITSKPKNRETEITKRKLRNEKRFGRK